jgi:TonB-dependent receptor
MKKGFFLFITVILSFSSFAQMATIKGQVIDKETKEGVLGVLVYNKDRKHSTAGDFDGNYNLKVSPGTHTIYFRMTGYEIDSVTMLFEAGKEYTHNTSLVEPSDLIGLQKELEIIGHRNNKSINSSLEDEKNAKVVGEVAGLEELKEKNVSNAATAVATTPGATVEGGKYVYVRGLSDRYSLTTLNGAFIPGLDPNRNSVQLDLFPVNMIEKITVVKSFAPNLPGSFTGGLVDITTRENPGGLEWSVNTKIGFNPQANLNPDFLDMENEGLDFLGFNSGDRGVPARARAYNYRDFPSRNKTNGRERLNNLGKEFNRDFSPTRKLSLFNFSKTFTIGNEIKLDSTSRYPTLGFNIGTSYSKSYQYYNNGSQGRYQLIGNYYEDNGLNPELVLNDERGTENVIWAALGNATLNLSKYSKIGIMASRFQNGVESTRYLEGNNYADANDLIFQTRSIFYQQRQLNNVQLHGDHTFGDKDSTGNNFIEKLNVSWIGSFTMSRQITPTLKFFTNDYTAEDGDTTWAIQAALYDNPAEFYRDMTESNTFGKVDFNLPSKWGDSTIVNYSFGFLGTYKNRSFIERRYDFEAQSGLVSDQTQFTGSVDEYMSDEKFDAGNVDGYIYVANASEKRNNYWATELQTAAYGMIEIEASERFRVITGTRAEYTDITAQSIDPAGEPGMLNNLDILPALNMTYDLKKDTTKIRFAYTRTLARPSFRELAPFSSFDFVGGNVTVGNDTLKRTLIDNLDLRYEFYPKRGENLTFGIFFKNFTNPIERAFNTEADREITWRNVESGLVYGAEIETRKKLGFLSKDSLNNNRFHVTFNASYIFSQVNVPDKELVVIRSQDSLASATRPMYGQSPYIVNASFGWKNDTTGWAANINFQVSGPRLAVVTKGGTPNVFEQPRPNLGFNLTKKFGWADHMQVKFSALNLLNPEYLQTYTFNGQQYKFNSFRRGQAFTLGFTYNFNQEKREEIASLAKEN